MKYVKMIILIPLQVSIHFRGPLYLKQFAGYAPNVAVEKRAVKTGPHFPHHAHQRFHGRKKSVVPSHKHGHVQREAGTDWVTASIDGQIVTGVNNFTTEASLLTSVVLAGQKEWVTATINGQIVSWVNNYTPRTTSTSTPAPEINQMGTVVAALSSLSSSSFAPTSTPADINQMGTVVAVSKNSKVNTGTGSQWTRQAYYSAENQTAEGLVFLNNMGGVTSGVFDLYAFFHANLSISYLTFIAAISVLPCHTRPVTQRLVLLLLRSSRTQ
jgi:hypothetical protein